MSKAAPTDLQMEVLGEMYARQGYLILGSRTPYLIGEIIPAFAVVSSLHHRKAELSQPVRVVAKASYEEYMEQLAGYVLSAIPMLEHYYRVESD